MYFVKERKCMSVILEDSVGEIWLLSKGAESTLFPNSVSGPKLESSQHIEEFAQVSRDLTVSGQLAVGQLAVRTTAAVCLLW